MKNLRGLITNYFLDAQSISINLNIEEIEKIVFAINALRKRSNTIYIAGNGGSASTASHFAADIGIGSLNRANPVRSMSLCDNSAAVTAIANDLDYSFIFTQQLKLLGQQGDLLIVISASGNSDNLLKAVGVASELGIESYSLTGFDGGTPIEQNDRHLRPVARRAPALNQKLKSFH